MPNIQISQLPAAGPITGTELVPIVQSGVTVQTTTQAIAASPTLTQTFLTVNQEPTLANSRSLAGNNGVTLVDGGAQAAMTVQLTGAALQFQNAAAGIMAKTSTSTVASRTITASGSGLQVTNGNGVSGNPTIALNGRAAALAALGGSSGLIALSGAGATAVDILGTAGEIDVANGGGPGNPTIGIADDAVLPGTGGVVIPKGDTAQQPVGTSGQIRFNTDTQTFDGYNGLTWSQFSTAGGVTSFDAGSTGLTPTTPTTGVVVLGGTLNVASGGSGANTLTGYLVGNGTSPFTAVATIPNAGLTNSAITINGSTVSLGGSVTVTATASSALTIGTGLTGTSYNGSAPVTIAIDSTVATLTGSQTLTNKSMSGATNTFSSIPNTALSNSTISGVSLGSNLNALSIGTGLTGTSYNGSGAVTVAIDSTVATLTGTQTFTNKSISGSTNTLTNIPNVALTNSSLTIGSTAISLGATSLTLAGLTSVALTQDPTADLQAATKQYVDAKASTGLIYHEPVQAGTTATLASITGGTVTYNNGVAGVGATLTLSVPLLVLDGYTLLNTNRILVKDEANQAHNGIYTWATGGTVLTRATDADSYGSNINQISQNDYFFIQNGTINRGSSYVVTTVGVIIFGTTAITFAEFSNSQVYTAGTGLTLTGTTFSITNTGVANGSYGTASSVPTIAVNAQGQITSASNTAIAINGNQITSGTVGSSYISGSYTGITGVGTLTAGTWNASTIGAIYGGTGQSSYTTGDLLYASGSSTLSKLALGTTNFVLTAGSSAPQYVAQSTLSVGSATTATTATNVAGGATGSLVYQTAASTTSTLALGTTNFVLTAGASAPQYVAQSTLSVGSATNATNATNTAITANSTNAANYLTFVSATTGNLPQLVNSSITCNPSTGQLTGGISGGIF
jgi:hypothetical protein